MDERSENGIIKYIGDIRFWIILFFLARLINITNPPLEVGHNWRQSIGAMVSRNFVEVDADIRYPRLDIGGEKTGITGMEFPIFNYITAGLDALFGVRSWHGRLVSLIFTSLGCWFFYKLIARYMNREVAFSASLILLVSLWFAYGRKVMPGTFSASLVIAAIYYGLGFLYDRDRWRWSSLFALLLLYSLGVSAKLSSACLMMVFVLPMLDSSIRMSRRSAILVVGVLGAIPIAYWYLFWVPHLEETYGFTHYFFGVDWSQGMQELWETKGQVLHRFMDNALKYVGFFMFLIGLVLSFRRKGRVYLYIFCLTFLAFFAFMVKAGDNVSHHSYYILPFIPVLALLAGYGVQQIPWRKAIPIVLAAILIEGVLNQLYDFRLGEENGRLARLDTWLDPYMSNDDLLLINSGLYPTPMYFAHRKGWVMPSDQLTSEQLDSLENLGLSHVLILKRTFEGNMDLPIPVLAENEDFKLYRLD